MLEKQIEYLNLELRNPIKVSDLKNKIRLSDSLETDFDLLDTIIIFGMKCGSIIEMNPSKNFDSKIIKLAKPIEFPFNSDTIEENNNHSLIVLSIPPFNQFGILENLKNYTNFLSLEEAFIKIINIAQREIWICSPFFDMRGLSLILPNLLLKINNKVTVSLLTRPSQINEIKILQKQISDENKLYFNIRTYHYEAKKRILSGIHTKLFGADETICYLGSGEVRINSYTKNLEMGIILEDENINLLRKLFDLIFKSSVIVNYEG